MSVIPVKYRGKKPALASWTPYQHRRPTDVEVKQWFEDNKEDTNVAIITGAVSGVLGLDSDGKEARGYTQELIENGLSPDTRHALNNTIWEETGGGGLHILIGYNPRDFPQGDPAAKEIESTKLWRGKGDHDEISLLGGGHCIVVAPSIHENGNEYKRIRGSKIQCLSKSQVLEVICAFRTQLGDAKKKKKEIDLQRQKQQGQDQSSVVFATTTGTARLQGPAPPSAELTDGQVMDVAVILNLTKWQNSEIRKEWLEKSADVTEGDPVVQTQTGLEFWFTPLHNTGQHAIPPRYKMAIVTGGIVFLLLSSLVPLIRQATAMLPQTLSILVTVAIMVPLMTYVIICNQTT